MARLAHADLVWGSTIHQFDADGNSTNLFDAEAEGWNADLSGATTLEIFDTGHTEEPSGAQAIVTPKGYARYRADFAPTRVSLPHPLAPQALADFQNECKTLGIPDAEPQWLLVASFG